MHQSVSKPRPVTAEPISAGRVDVNPNQHCFDAHRHTDRGSIAVLQKKLFRALRTVDGVVETVLGTRALVRTNGVNP
jgi:hypothetical protein